MHAKCSSNHLSTRWPESRPTGVNLGPGLPVRLDGFDGVAHADRAALEDLGPEPGSVNQGPPHPGARQALEVCARFSELEAAQHDAADPKRAPDEMVEGNALGHDVAARLVLADLDLVLAAGGGDCLALDEGDGAPAVVVGLRVLTFAGGVPVAVEADPGRRLDAVARFHRRALVGRRVDGDDVPPEHARQSRVPTGSPFIALPGANRPGAIRTSPCRCRGWSCTRRARAGTATCARRARRAAPAQVPAPRR